MVGDEYENNDIDNTQGKNKEDKRTEDNKDTEDTEEKREKINKKSKSEDDKDEKGNPIFDEIEHKEFCHWVSTNLI